MAVKELKNIDYALNRDLAVLTSVLIFYSILGYACWPWYLRCLHAITLYYYSVISSSTDLDSDSCIFLTRKIKVGLFKQSIANPVVKIK